MKSKLKHVKEVCKIGQGTLCCRYLMATPEGFECGKLNEDIKALMDAKVFGDLTIAVGDNCKGITKEKLNDFLK